MPIFFCLFIIFCVWFSYEVKKSNSLSAKHKEDYFEREHEANFTPKQSTDELVRITMPDNLPFHDYNNCDDECQASNIINNNTIDLNAVSEINYIENKICDTFSHEIINLTGYTNTDLKLKYGRGNIDYLSECDGYFTQLVSQLLTWAKLLNKNELHDDCKKVLDYAISINADSTDLFTMRATYYVSDNEIDKINSLIDIAQTLNTIKKDIIISKLNDILIENIT